MYKISAMVDEGVGGHGNDDRAVVMKTMISDGYYTESGEKVFAAVFDGVGGAAFGYEAASIAAETFIAVDDDFTEDLIMRTIDVANASVCDRQKCDGVHSRMSTTVAGIMIYGDKYLMFNVGDSRVYRYRAPYIAQLSTDHSLSAAWTARGLKAPPEYEHVITHCIGSDMCEANVIKGDVIQEDVFMVCTDGVCDVLSYAELENLLAQDISEEELCRSIIDEAIRKGSQDNLSVIIIRRNDK